LALIGVCLSTFLLLLPGYMHVGHVRFGVHSLLFAAVGIIVGVQLASMGLIASLFGARESFWYDSGRLQRIRRLLTIDRGCATGGAMIAAALIGFVIAISSWARAGYGDLTVENEMRLVIPSMLLGVVGLQFALTCFLVELLGRPARPHHDD
jgi:hypothetical protein